MLKQVTCALSTIKRTAEKSGVRLGHDVVVRELNPNVVAVRGDTLQGQLFLSLLVCGALD